MILVMILAVILTLANLVRRGIDPFLRERWWDAPVVWVNRGLTRYVAVWSEA
jgi:hypothetical protein